MSAAIATDEEPYRWVTVPGHPEVGAQYVPDLGFLEYFGKFEDLIAAGVATEAMRVQRPKRDADGDRFSLIRYLRVTTVGGEPCPPYYCCRLKLIKPVDRLPRLPGAAEAIAAQKAWNAWATLRWPHLYSPVDQDLPRPPRPALRLVVDNTREERP